MKTLTSRQKSILITGASSGIGNTATVYLAEQGYTVLATVRKDSDADNLNKLGVENLELRPGGIKYPYPVRRHPDRLFGKTRNRISGELHVRNRQLPGKASAGVG